MHISLFARALFRKPLFVKRPVLAVLSIECASAGSALPYPASTHFNASPCRFCDEDFGPGGGGQGAPIKQSSSTSSTSSSSLSS
jgi:hypothetical protein